MLHRIPSFHNWLEKGHIFLTRQYSKRVLKVTWGSNDIKSETRRIELEEETERLLTRNPTNKYPMSHVDFNIAIDSWAKVAPKIGEHAATQAEKLLNRLETLHKSNRLRLETAAYNSCLNAYAKSNGGETAALKAQLIFNRFSWKKNHISFHSLMDAWVRSNSPKAGRQSQLLLKHMQHLGLKPNARTYSLLINSLDADEASAVLRQMIHNYSEQNGICPDIIVFNNVLNAWAISGKGAYAVNRAQEVFTWLEHFSVASNDASIETKPNTQTYSTLLNVWAKSRVKDSAPKAEEILNHMKNLHEQGSNVKPNVISFTNVMHAWSNSTEKHGAEKAENIMNELLTLYNVAGDEEFQPSVKTWNTLMDVWAKKVPVLGLRAVEKAFDVFRRMELFGKNIGNYAPDTTSYNILMHALSKSYSSKAQTMSEDLFHQMQSSKVLPNTITYNNLLNIYAQVGDTKKAELILSQMEDQYNNEGQKYVKPDTISYSTVIKCWAKSLQPGMAKKSFSLFQKMSSTTTTTTTKNIKNSNFKPDAIAYHSLLNACANTSLISSNHYSSLKEKNIECTDALTIMNESYKDIIMRSSQQRKKHNYRHYTNSISLNEHHYNALLKGCNNLIVNEKEKVLVVGRYVTQCCEDGYLSSSVYHQLSRMLLVISDDEDKGGVLGLLLNVDDYNGIAKEWTRNVNRGHLK